MPGVWVLQKSLLTDATCWADFKQVAEKWFLQAAGRGHFPEWLYLSPTRSLIFAAVLRWPKMYVGFAWKRLKCGPGYVREHTSATSLYLGGFWVPGILMTMWQFFFFVRNWIVNVILFLSGFLVVIKFKLSKQILVLTVMLCSLLIQWNACPCCPESNQDW